VVLWDTKTWQELRRLHGHTRVTALAFSPDGRWLASGGTDNTVTVRDSTSLELWATLTGHAQQVTRLAWSSDSSALVTAGGDHALTLWPLDVNQAIRNLCQRLKGEDRSVTRVCATTR
jgi:WD40 repeat protein